MESVVRKLKISLLELAREPLDLFVREAGGMTCGRSDVIWNVTDVIPLLKLRGVGEMRLVDVSLERGGLALLALIVDGVGARLQQRVQYLLDSGKEAARFLRFQLLVGLLLRRLLLEILLLMLMLLLLLPLLMGRSRHSSSFVEISLRLLLLPPVLLRRGLLNGPRVCGLQELRARLPGDRQD